MLEIKRDYTLTRFRAEEFADYYLKNPSKGINYADVVRRVYRGAVVADRIARYFSEFEAPQGKAGAKYVMVGGCGGGDEARFGIFVKDILWNYKTATVAVNLETGVIKVNVDGMHKMFEYVTYTKGIDIDEIGEHLINHKYNVIIGDCDWYDSCKVKVINEIRYLSTVGEYQLQIIHPRLGYTGMKITEAKMKKYGLMQFVKEEGVSVDYRI
jgi:hypothetical protein